MLAISSTNCCQRSNFSSCSKRYRAPNSFVFHSIPWAHFLPSRFLLASAEFCLASLYLLLALIQLSSAVQFFFRSRPKCVIRHSCIVVAGQILSPQVLRSVLLSPRFWLAPRAHKCLINFFTVVTSNLLRAREFLNQMSHVFQWLIPVQFCSTSLSPLPLMCLIVFYLVSQSVGSSLRAYEIYLLLLEGICSVSLPSVGFFFYLCLREWMVVFDFVVTSGGPISLNGRVDCSIFLLTPASPIFCSFPGGCTQWAHSFFSFACSRVPNFVLFVLPSEVPDCVLVISNLFFFPRSFFALECIIPFFSV